MPCHYLDTIMFPCNCMIIQIQTKKSLEKFHSTYSEYRKVNLCKWGLFHGSLIFDMHFAAAYCEHCNPSYCLNLMPNSLLIISTFNVLQRAHNKDF